MGNSTSTLQSYPLITDPFQVGYLYDLARATPNGFSISSLVTEYEQMEPGYQQACLDAQEYLENALSTNNGKIFYKNIFQAHQIITENVNGLPINLQPGKIVTQSLNFFRVSHHGEMIISPEMSKIYLSHALIEHTYNPYNGALSSLTRKGVENENLIRTHLENIIKKYNETISQADTPDDKEKLIYNTCQMLELLHPFRDANCRLFIMTLMNVLRKNRGLPIAAFADPNLVDRLTYDDIKKFEGLMIQMPTSEPTKEQINDMILKAVVASNFVKNCKNIIIYKKKWTTQEMISIIFTNKIPTEYGISLRNIIHSRKKILSVAADMLGNRIALKYACSIYPGLVKTKPESILKMLEHQNNKTELETETINACIQSIKQSCVEYLDSIIYFMKSDHSQSLPTTKTIKFKLLHLNHILELYSLKSNLGEPCNFGPSLFKAPLIMTTDLAHPNPRPYK